MEKTNKRDFNAETMDFEQPEREPELEAAAETPALTTQGQEREAEAKLPSPDKRRAPRMDLLEHQLNGVAREGGVGAEHQSNLRKGTIDTYDSLSPKNGTDSILVRLIVGMTNLTMHCIARAGTPTSLRAEEIGLRYSVKGTEALIKLIQLNDSRSGRGRRKVTVGTVNVKQGGQAIVGNVDAKMEGSDTGPTDESED